MWVTRFQGMRKADPRKGKGTLKLIVDGERAAYCCKQRSNVTTIAASLCTASPTTHAPPGRGSAALDCGPLWDP